MPRHSKRIYKDNEIWDIVHYVITLPSLKKPKASREIKSIKVEGSLPMNPEDDAWKAGPSFYIPLAGQILESEKNFYPTIDSVWIQAIHNGDEIAFKLRWDDPNFDPILKTLAEVQESPPPPLPPEFQMDPSDDAGKPAEVPKAQKYPDAIAIQFPAGKSGDGSLPYFLNGDKEHPVNLWTWISGSNKTIEWHAQLYHSIFGVLA